MFANNKNRMTLSVQDTAQWQSCAAKFLSIPAIILLFGELQKCLYLSQILTDFNSVKKTPICLSFASLIKHSPHFQLQYLVGPNLAIVHCHKMEEMGTLSQNESVWHNVTKWNRQAHCHKMEEMGTLSQYGGNAHTVTKWKRWAHCHKMKVLGTLSQNGTVRKDFRKNKPKGLKVAKEVLRADRLNRLNGQQA